ncbi:MAG: hypothetical protein ACT443_01040, partial [Gemmatimonadota bacterium]
ILALALAPTALAAQQPASRIISSEIAVSRERAEIKLELEDGRKLTLATTTAAPADASLQRSTTSSGDQILTLGVERGGELDRSWRELLNRAMEVETSQLGGILRDWQSPNARGADLDATLEAALLGQLPPAAPVPPGMNDSVVKLETRIQQLEEQLHDARDDATSTEHRRPGPDMFAPVRHIVRGITGIFALLITYAVLFGIGFVVVMFGGRKYIEGVADTVREGAGRSFLVGLAGSFLLVPVFVLGIIALAISIVGIPALLVWIPLFPVATLLAGLLGLLGVAHAAGERWAERHYNGNEWFNRANSYYFMATGLVLFSAFFVAANVIAMAGPWLGWLNALLNVFGVLVTISAALIGFGAVLLSRGGSRPAGADTLASSAYTEGAGV